MKLIQTHALKSGTRATKNELVMDLAKTKAQVAQVREKPTRLQFIGGLQDLHKDTICHSPVLLSIWNDLSLALIFVTSINKKNEYSQDYPKLSKICICISNFTFTFACDLKSFVLKHH